MALDRPAIIKAVKNRIYNSGLGEKPSIRQGAVDTATVADDTVVFDLATNEGAKVRQGHILSSYNSTDADDAYGFYVLDVTGDIITMVNGYDGAAIVHAATIPLLFEHQAEVTEYQVQRAIDDIVTGYLFPELFDIALVTVTPNLASLQSDANALDQETLRAWQRIGGVTYQLPIKLVENMPTSLFASGKMVTYDVRSGADFDYSVKRKISIATSTDEALEGLIAKGAAALCVEGVEQAMDEEVVPQSRPLWASFYNQKRQMETSIAKQSATQFKVDRN